MLRLLTALGVILAGFRESSATVSLVVANSTGVMANVTNIPFIGACGGSPTMTAFQATLLACATSPVNITFEYSAYSFGIYINSIDGVPTTSKAYWSLSLNGKAASVGADSVVLNDGDVVGWTFTHMTS